MWNHFGPIFYEIGNPFQNLPDMFKELSGIFSLAPGFVFRYVSGLLVCGGIAQRLQYIYIYIDIYTPRYPQRYIYQYVHTIPDGDDGVMKEA